MELKKSRRIIEALLFASGEPLTVAQIVSAVDGLDARSAATRLGELQSEYDEGSHGFQLVEVENGYQLTTRAEYSQWVRRLFAKQISSRLTTAALEALAIVAYHQPVTRSEVEEIRGVNSDSVLNSLIERKLVTIAGRKDVPGRPLLYATTDAFLRHFGLRDVADLPSLEELSQLFDAPLEPDGDEHDAS